ncbi:DnaA regulatory inactivator Hda [Congregibacter variabilis]|uniref:DnaA regulatory inactivator Hda n=1 Tax=Congregibacter variabilis TaxID=3081200 RepID=A0ABZ0I4U3_9GAMM|nr:DnaA regulatory inactivator Hda [Congregibacter sp. IMCC43200]
MMPDSAHSRDQSPQLPLQIGLEDDSTFDNFLARKALAPLLDSLSRPNTEPLQFIHGAAGEGKSHLLQALCHATEGALYLPLCALLDSPAKEVLQDLESSSLLALDELEAIAGRSDWEEALFHLINRARATQCPLWIAARRPATDLGVQLADLSSRLAGGVTWAIGAASDDDKLEILKFRAQRRGLLLPDAVAQYLCSRESRALCDLMGALDRLDRASLQLQRPLTVPLVREVMAW